MTDQVKRRRSTTQLIGKIADDRDAVDCPIDISTIAGYAYETAMNRLIQQDDRELLRRCGDKLTVHHGELVRILEQLPEPARGEALVHLREAVGNSFWIGHYAMWNPIQHQIMHDLEKKSSRTARGEMDQITAVKSKAIEDAFYNLPLIERRRKSHRIAPTIREAVNKQLEIWWGEKGTEFIEKHSYKTDGGVRKQLDKLQLDPKNRKAAQVSRKAAQVSS
jgi:hypothetical protein